MRSSVYVFVRSSQAALASLQVHEEMKSTQNVSSGRGTCGLFAMCPEGGGCTMSHTLPRLPDGSGLSRTSLRCMRRAEPIHGNMNKDFGGVVMRACAPAQSCRTRRS